MKRSIVVAAVLFWFAACGKKSGGLPDGSLEADGPVAIDATPIVHNCNPNDVPTLIAALADVTCTTVTIATGTYVGNFSVNHDVTIVGTGVGMTILDGQSAGTVLTLRGSLTSLSQLTIQHGNAGSGGGVLASGSATFTDVAFSNNVATQSGGALSMNLSNGSASLTILRGSFSQNSVMQTGSGQMGAQGGAIATRHASVSITDSQFEGNSVSASDLSSAQGGAVIVDTAPVFAMSGSMMSGNSVQTTNQNAAGGAMSLSDCTQVTIDTSQFEMNTATSSAGSVNGGALQISADQAGDSAATFTTVDFSNNTATGIGASGGAMFLNSSSLIGSQVTFDGNQSTSTPSSSQNSFAFGGALVAGGADVTLQGCSFTNNGATLTAPLTGTTPNSGIVAGGAIQIGNANLALTDVIIENNNATNEFAYGAYGGAISMNAAGSNFTVTDSSIVDNNATFSATGAVNGSIGGGGVSISSESGTNQVTFINSFIAENGLVQSLAQNNNLTGSQVYGESFGTSVLQLAFRNATLMQLATSDSPEVLGTSISGTSTMSLDFANTILDAHSDVMGCGEPTGLSVMSDGYNLMSESCLPVLNDGDVILSAITGDPSSGLQPQQVTNSGFPYYAITTDSPAFNGGNPTGCTDLAGNVLTTDGLGQPRFGNCDIGAYEVQPLPP